MSGATPTSVRTAREALGLSREGLAYKAGVSVRTVERWETGQYMPRRATRKVVADVLGLDPLDLLTKEAA